MLLGGSNDTLAYCRCYHPSCRLLVLIDLHLRSLDYSIAAPSPLLAQLFCLLLVHLGPHRAFNLPPQPRSKHVQVSQSWSLYSNRHCFFPLCLAHSSRPHRRPSSALGRHISSQSSITIYKPERRLVQSQSCFYTTIIIAVTATLDRSPHLCSIPVCIR